MNHLQSLGRRIATTALLVLAVVGIAGFTSVPADAQEARLRAPLRGVDNPASGHADFERRETRSCLSVAAGRCKLSVEVEDFPVDGDYPVLACGVNVGDVSVVAGFGDLNLDTDDGDSVPNCRRGDGVSVGDPAVVTGVMRRH